MNPNPSWFEHVDLMQAAIVSLIGVIAYVFKRGMDRNVAVMDRIFEKLDDQAARLSKLEGEHQALACKGPPLTYPRDGVPHFMGD